jgi:hypothetical protein
VFLVGWPHGWDYRALGALLGDLDWNGLLWGSASDGSDSVLLAEMQVGDPSPKLYFVGGDRAESNIAQLKEYFPSALSARHDSAVTGKTFWTVLVPGETTEAGGG